MPTYDFKCPKCQLEWEAAQGMNDPNPKCENLVCAEFPDPTMGHFKCGGEAVKIFKKAGAVHFNGSGWAKDGYSK